MKRENGATEHGISSRIVRQWVRVVCECQWVRLPSGANWVEVLFIRGGSKVFCGDYSPARTDILHTGLVESVLEVDCVKKTWSAINTVRVKKFYCVERNLHRLGELLAASCCTY